MKKNKLSEWSLEKLQGMYKILQTLQYFVLAVVILFGAFAFYGMVTGTFDTKSALITAPIFLFVSVILLKQRMELLKVEINSRKSEEEKIH